MLSFLFWQCVLALAGAVAGWQQFKRKETLVYWKRIQGHEKVTQNEALAFVSPLEYICQTLKNTVEEVNISAVWVIFTQMYTQMSPVSLF